MVQELDRVDTYLESFRSHLVSVHSAYRARGFGVPFSISIAFVDQGADREQVNFLFVHIRRCLELHSAENSHGCHQTL